MFSLKSQKANCSDKDVSRFVTVKFFRSVFYRQGNGLAVFDGKARQHYSTFTLANKTELSFVSAVCYIELPRKKALTFLCVSKIMI